jgi:hypothetical protein
MDFTGDVLDLVGDKNNNIIVGGTYSENFFLNKKYFKAVGRNDCFITQIDNNGEVIWGKSYGGMADENIYTIDVDYQGNVYIAGRFFGSPSFGSYTLQSIGKSDVFIAKLNRSGDVIWVRSVGSVSGGQDE